MQLFSKEKENRDHLLNLIDQEVKIKVIGDNLFSKLFVGKEIPVPYRHIYMPHRRELEIWCFKQDICIYEKLFDKSVGYKEAFITAGNEKMQIRLEKSNVQNTENVGMPLTIVETKMAKNIDTHILLAYSEKVNMIKSIFPFCSAFLLIFGQYPAIAYRQIYAFDDIICLENLGEDSCRYAVNRVINGLDKAWEKIILMTAD
ncbi:MAG: hypothetical protein FWD87_08915 [Spirochaetaceae bacterium]|nr:hypothetical protein [Spirochaetaceae bacterium]